MHGSTHGVCIGFSPNFGCMEDASAYASASGLAPFFSTSTYASAADFPHRVLAALAHLSCFSLYLACSLSSLSLYSRPLFAKKHSLNLAPLVIGAPASPRTL